MSELTVAQDMPQEARTDGLAGMYGNRRHAPVGMAQAMLAPLRADDSKTGFLKRANECFAVRRLRRGIYATFTCWTPIKVRRD